MTTSSSETLNAAPAGFGLSTPDGQVVYPSGVYLQTLFETSRLGAQLSWERRSGAHALAGGLELARERTDELEARGNLDYLAGQPLPDVVDLPGAVSDRSRRTLAAWLQVTWTHWRVTATGSLRCDALSDAQDGVAPRAALQVDLGQGLDARALYARGWRPPTFAELAFNLPGQLANPALRGRQRDSDPGRR